MNDKLDKVLTKLAEQFDSWLSEFESAPVRTTIKVVLILYIVKWARKNLL